MKKLSHLMLATAFLIFVGGPALGAAPAGAAKKAPPPPRPIPGITAPDKFPNGCVDCHVNMPEQKMDVRLSTLLKQWQEKVEPALLDKVKTFAPSGMALKGRHPKLAQGVGEAPTTCLKCHSQSSKFAPPFNRLLHGLHLVGGEKNHFMTVFQGECTHCHRLDPANGAWSVKSGKEKE